MVKPKTKILKAAPGLPPTETPYSRFFKSGGARYYPLNDDADHAGIAIAYLGELPSVISLGMVPEKLLLEVLSKFGFLEVISENIYDEGYKLTGRAYYNSQYNVFLTLLYSGGGDSYYAFSSEYTYPAREVDINDIRDIMEIEDGVGNVGETSVFQELTETSKVSGDAPRVKVYFPCSLSDNSWFLKLKEELGKLASLNIKPEIKKNHVNFLCYDRGSYKLKNVKVNRKTEVDLSLNYGDNFPKVHDALLKFLASEETGLALLYGDPGMGKTFYLRYLLSILDKTIVYIPPHLINRVAEPDFLGFLLNQKDFVLVIEDAEEIVTNRQDTNNTAGVSNLLNLTDGILGDCIQVKILATFNSAIKNIDPALLRKGRLKINHEFKKLSVEQSNKLLKILNINFLATEPMSLSDIYNAETDNFRKEEERVALGFRV